MVTILRVGCRLDQYLHFAVLLLALIWMGLCSAADSGDADEKRKFDHLAETGFELLDVHRLAECTDCHIFETFAGTPRTCRGCHGSQGIRTASRKGAMHILSTDNCENCHMTSTANSWVPVRRVDHLEVRGTCNRCHNGVIAGGKSPNHIRSTNQCDACHRSTRAWVNVFRVDHTEIPEAQAGICSTCHFAGSPYGGKNAGHIRGGIDSTNNCDACHLTVGNWPVKGGIPDHKEILGGAGIPFGGSNCKACHENIRPPLPHPPAPLECGNAGCHGSTRDWCSMVGFSIPGLCM